MGGFERQVKLRAYEIKGFFKKGVRTVSNTFRKGWYKVKRVKHKH
jgi:hypothetical protein